jgi:hypothetical protein
MQFLSEVIQMNELIVPIPLILFMVFVYPDIPLELQGLTGFIVGFITAVNTYYDKKKNDASG